MSSNVPNPSPERSGSVPKAAAQAAPPSRKELIDKFRDQAVRNENPLAANFAIISSDLMAFAGVLAESVTPLHSQLADSPDALQQFERRAQLYLRVTREIARMTTTALQLEK